MISVPFSPKAFLPKSAQKAIQDRLFADWREEKDTPWAKSPLRRVGSADAISRSEQSYWKTTQDHRYGGQMWLRFLIALGYIPTAMIGIVNEEVNKKVFAIEFRWSAGARKSDTSRALAKSQGKDPKEVHPQWCLPHCLWHKGGESRGETA